MSRSTLVWLGMGEKIKAKVLIRDHCMSFWRSEKRKRRKRNEKKTVLRNTHNRLKNLLKLLTFHARLKTAVWNTIKKEQKSQKRPLLTETFFV